MALFKILRGNSEDLKTLKTTDGYAYFTPDDGKFYIDIADSTVPVTGNHASQTNGVNRICINSFNDIILDCGTASGWSTNATTTTVYYIAGDADFSDETDVIQYSAGDADFSDEINVIILNGNTY